MIHDMSSMEVLKVPQDISLLSITRWLTEKELVPNEDWEFYGIVDHSFFSLGIKDKNIAMLFKLTWCGK